MADRLGLTTVDSCQGDIGQLGNLTFTNPSDAAVVLLAVVRNGPQKQWRTAAMRAVVVDGHEHLYCDLPVSATSWPELEDALASLELRTERGDPERAVAGKA